MLSFGEASGAEEADAGPARVMNEGPWTKQEKELYMDAVRLHGRDAPKIAAHVGSKTLVAVRAFWGRQRKRLGLDKLVEEHQRQMESGGVISGLLSLAAAGCEDEDVAGTPANKRSAQDLESGPRDGPSSISNTPKVRVVVSSQGRPESVSVAPEQLALPPSGKGGSRKRQSAPSSLASEVQAVIHEHAVAQPEVSTDAGSGGAPPAQETGGSEEAAASAQSAPSDPQVAGDSAQYQMKSQYQQQAIAAFTAALTATKQQGGGQTMPPGVHLNTSSSGGQPVRIPTQSRTGGKGGGGAGRAPASTSPPTASAPLQLMAPPPRARSAQPAPGREAITQGTAQLLQLQHAMAAFMSAGGHAASAGAGFAPQNPLNPNASGALPSPTASSALHPDRTAQLAMQLGLMGSDAGAAAAAMRAAALGGAQGAHAHHQLHSVAAQSAGNPLMALLMAQQQAAAAHHHQQQSAAQAAARQAKLAQGHTHPNHSAYQAHTQHFGGAHNLQHHLMSEAGSAVTAGYGQSHGRPGFPEQHTTPASGAMVLHQPKGDDRGSPGLGPMSAAGPHVTEGLVPSAMLGLMQAQMQQKEPTKSESNSDHVEAAQRGSRDKPPTGPSAGSPALPASSMATPASGSQIPPHGYNAAVAEEYARQQNLAALMGRAQLPPTSMPHSGASGALAHSHAQPSGGGASGWELALHDAAQGPPPSSSSASPNPLQGHARHPGEDHRASPNPYPSEQSQHEVQLAAAQAQAAAAAQGAFGMMPPGMAQLISANPSMARLLVAQMMQSGMPGGTSAAQMQAHPHAGRAIPSMGAGTGALEREASRSAPLPGIAELMARGGAQSPTTAYGWPPGGAHPQSHMMHVPSPHAPESGPNPGALAAASLDYAKLAALLQQQQLNQWMATARGGEVKSETVGAEAIARASESGGRGGAIPESMHQYAHQYASVQAAAMEMQQRMAIAQQHAHHNTQSEWQAAFTQAMQAEQARLAGGKHSPVNGDK
mmetsp:Transcript_37529/g.71923  ORF Transcript_37529/g.71923 Transcript_37529/m.71923 type:complete len:994 (+) Transcript_37529:52-3033(+)